MPLVKRPRAPGMVFYVVALVTAMFAGLGAERALRGGGKRLMTPALILGGIVALLGVTGVFGHIAETVAAAKAAAAGTGQAGILWGTVSRGLPPAAPATGPGPAQ